MREGGEAKEIERGMWEGEGQGDREKKEGAKREKGGGNEGEKEVTPHHANKTPRNTLHTPEILYSRCLLLTVTPTVIRGTF